VNAPVALRGRPRRADPRDDLSAHVAEALEFVDACWPLVSRLEVVARECGPEAYQTALMLGQYLARYERRHLPDGDGGLAVAA
jgi:hypothetical protein